MQPCPGIADLRAGHQRRSVIEPRCGCRAARALRDILVDFAFLVGTGTETLDRGIDQARIQLLQPLPGEPHAVEDAGTKILDQHVADLDEALENFLALGVFAVDGDRALVVVQHGEIQAVHLGDVLQLPARDVADAGSFHLDYVRAEPGEKLRAGRARLHVGEIEDADAVECFHLMLLPSSSARFSG